MSFGGLLPLVLLEEIFYFYSNYSIFLLPSLLFMSLMSLEWVFLSSDSFKDGFKSK